MIMLTNITMRLLYTLTFLKGIYQEITTRIQLHQLISKYHGYDNIPLEILSIIENTPICTSKKYKEIDYFLDDVIDLCELLEIHFEDSKFCRMIDCILHQGEEKKFLAVHVTPLCLKGIKRRQVIFRKMEELGDITQQLIDRFTECGKLREVLLWVNNESVV